MDAFLNAGPRLLNNIAVYEFFMNWKTPLIAASLYTVAITLLNPKPSPSGAKVSRIVAQQNSDLAKNAKTTHSSQAFTAFIFVHNLFLCIYSVITFIHMGGGVVDHIRAHDRFKDAYCDTDRYLWTHSLEYWGYLFYLSKYYEVIDTIIILVKGRRSSLLQTYHHAGAVITMWAGMSYQSTPIWIFVVFNSFIHSIMYAYYAVTSVGFTPPGKKFLTGLQITQFLIGTTLAASYLFVPDCVTTPGKRFAIWVNVLYLLPLTYLFIDFAVKMYGKRVTKKAQKNE